MSIVLVALQIENFRDFRTANHAHREANQPHRDCRRRRRLAPNHLIADAVGILSQPTGVRSKYRRQHISNHSEQRLIDGFDPNTIEWWCTIPQSHGGIPQLLDKVTFMGVLSCDAPVRNDGFWSLLNVI